MALSLLVARGAVTTDAVSAANSRVDRVTIRGDVQSVLKLSAVDLAALPQREVDATFLAAGTPQTHHLRDPRRS